MSAEAVTTFTFGSLRNNNFVPLEVIRSIGLAFTRNKFNGIELNGQYFGTEGTKTETLFLDDGEFITEVKGALRSNQNIIALTLTTSFGRSITAGTANRNDQEFSLTGGEVRSMGIATGSNGIIAGVHVQQLPPGQGDSVIVEEEVLAVLNVIPQFQTITTFTSSELSRLNAASQLQDRQFSKSVSGKVSASVKIGTKFANAKFSTKLARSSNSKVSTRKGLTEELEERELTSEQVTVSIPEGFVGLEVVKVQRLVEEDGFTWLYPVGSPEIITVPIEDGLESQEFYDLTGVLRSILSGVDSKRAVDGKAFPFYAKESERSLALDPSEFGVVRANAIVSKLQNDVSGVGAGLLAVVCAALIALVVGLFVKRKAANSTSRGETEASEPAKSQDVPL